MKKSRQKMIKYRIGTSSRMVACVSFLVLALIAVSSLVRAMSLSDIANADGTPSSWEASSGTRPSQITVPITYWDQRQDQDCWIDNEYDAAGNKAHWVKDSSSWGKPHEGWLAPNRQFEWVECTIYAHDVAYGLVKDTLGADGYPVPAFTNTDNADGTIAAGIDKTSWYVTGHDPVLPTDNFYRWFHNTEKSQRVDGRTVTFTTNDGGHTYTYGNKGVFPINDFDFSQDDPTTIKSNGTNFHYTAHLQFALRVKADGTEVFKFEGDDDVWVFLNNKLVLDIGGLHEMLPGYFTINQDNTITTYTHDKLSSSDMTKRTYNLSDFGIKKGDIVNLDFFYAERSTNESNMRITITDMDWPINGRSTIDGKIIGQKEDGKNIIQYDTSLVNRDTATPLDLIRLAAYIQDVPTESPDNTTSGFLPLDLDTLQYTYTPEDESSWQHIGVSAPSNSLDGFSLDEPIHLNPSGQAKDRVYFRYFAETSSDSGKISGKISYFTAFNRVEMITYDTDVLLYAPKEPDPVDPVQLTIKYQYEDGSKAAEDYTASLYPGDSYDVTSPSIADHTPNQAVVSGAMPDEPTVITVIYKTSPVETPDPIKVTIKYVYEETGQEAAPTYYSEFEPGTDFSITSPVIPDYTADQASVSGTVDDHDLEFTVVYTKIPTPPAPVNPDPVDPDPTTPVDPEGPTPTPTEPEPSVPIIPDSDLLDSDLLYLAPLGAVAYVPSTGIVSSATAGIFEQDFAELILSQGFVMVVLFIFSGSFALYFTNRKHLKPATAPHRSYASNRIANNNRATTRKNRTPANKNRAQTITKRTSTKANHASTNAKRASKKK